MKGLLETKRRLGWLNESVTRTLGIEEETASAELENDCIHRYTSAGGKIRGK